jgi:hypothetical protein
MRAGTRHLPLGVLTLAAVACGSSTKSAPKDAGSGLRDALPYDAKLVDVDSGHVQQGHVDVLMQHNDVSRTGQNLNETVLTTSNVAVGTFGKLLTLPVDGLIYAQPLIVTGYPLGDAGTRDLLVVATMHNSVYAFDANSGAPLWQVNLGPSVPNTAIGPINPMTGKPQGTLNIQVEVGILSTPFIDRVNGLIYLTRKDYTNSVQSLKLHVLDLATGKDKAGSPATITAEVPGTAEDANDAGMITMNPGYVAQRPGLLLFQNTIYLAFASHEDFQPYHGWILGYTYSASAGTLTQTHVFNVTPDGEEGGIWNSGQGLLTDGTSIYALASNGTVTVQNGGKSYGEAFLKLSPELVVQDWFIPVNYGNLNRSDIDLGSGGPVLIPGTSPLLIAGGGKQGIMYVVDTTNMGHLGTVDDENTQEWQAVTHSIYSPPVLWTGGGDPRLYVWGSGDVLREYELENGLFETTPEATTGTDAATPNFIAQDPTGNLAVSSNGSMPGTGIVWACKPLSNPDHMTVAGTFFAFDAMTLKELWDSNQNAARDSCDSYAKFVPPTVANGRVYLATHSKEVLVYGLLADRDQ